MSKFKSGEVQLEIDIEGGRVEYAKGSKTTVGDTPAEKWQKLYEEAGTIVDPSWRSGCQGSIQTHALCLLFGIPTLFSYEELAEQQRHKVEKDNKEQGR